MKNKYNKVCTTCGVRRMKSKIWDDCADQLRAMKKKDPNLTRALIEIPLSIEPYRNPFPGFLNLCKDEE